MQIKRWTMTKALLKDCVHLTSLIVHILLQMERERTFQSVSLSKIIPFINSSRSWNTWDKFIRGILRWIKWQIDWIFKSLQHQVDILSKFTNFTLARSSRGWEYPKYSPGISRRVLSTVSLRIFAILFNVRSSTYFFSSLFFLLFRERKEYSWHVGGIFIEIDRTTNDR